MTTGGGENTAARTAPGTISIVLGILSMLAVPAVGLFLAFTPFVLAGKYAFIGVVCGTAIFIAAIGLAQGVACWRDAARLPEHASRRGIALSRGFGASVFCGLLVVGYVLLWVWAPTQIVSTPLGG